MNSSNPLDILLAAGQLAPSADNCQPWLFKKDKNNIFLFHDHENTHANHIYNINHFADFVSLGTVLENIHQQAKHLGWEIKIELLKHNAGEPLAKISLEKEDSKKSLHLYEYLTKRKTNRRKFFKKPIHPELKNEAIKLAQENQVNLQWIDSAQEISKLSKLISTHDTILWEDQKLRENLVRMLRFGKKIHSDGLSLESLELGPKRHFFKPSIAIANQLPFIWKLLGIGSVLHTRNNIKHSNAIGLMTIPKKQHPHTYIQGGRALQSVWLKMSEYDISIQPLFGPIAFILNGQLEKGGLLPKHERIRKEIENYFTEKFPNLKSDAFVALFRAGYANKPTSISGRKDLEKMIKNI